MLTLAATAAGLTLLGSASAQAGTYIVTETPSHVLACYDRVYVPQTVEYNTRGILVQRETVDWEIVGDRWQRVRHPAVYIETRRLLEQDHYKLVPCP